MVFRAGLLLALSFLLHQKDLLISIEVIGHHITFLPEQLHEWKAPPWSPAVTLTPAEQKAAKKWSNLAFVLKPDIWKTLGVSRRLAAYKRQQVEEYLRQMVPLAFEEKARQGIPVSIKLAQALWETDAGSSILARKARNHFGIKCPDHCPGCACFPFADDDPYDKFREYDSVRESFRHHSRLMHGKRYRHLLHIDPHDYRSWAEGLQKAGYATDPQYAERLIAIIEALKLHAYDRPNSQLPQASNQAETSNLWCGLPIFPFLRSDPTHARKTIFLEH